MKRLSLLLLVLIAALLFFWWRGGEDLDAPGGAPDLLDRRAVAPDARPMPPSEEPQARAAQPRLAGARNATTAPAEAGQATLRCRVLDPEGMPRPRSVVCLQRVTLVDPPAEAPPVPGFEGVKLLHSEEVARARADASGVVSFRDLPPGTYGVVSLAPPGLLAPARSVELTEAVHEVDLAYRRSVRAEVEVLDPDGQPVPKAVVSLLHAVGNCSGVADERGMATLEELDPRWAGGLEVRPPDGLELFEERLESWAYRDTRIVLRRSFSLTVQVVDQEAAPVPKATVSIGIGGGEGWQIWTANDEGRCRIRGLERGEKVRVRAAPPGSWTAARTEVVTAEAGGGELVLVLPGGRTFEIVVAEWPEGARGEIRLTATDPEAGILSQRIGDDGRCTFGHLDPRMDYILWGTLRGDGRFLYASRVRCDREPFEIALQEGEEIQVRVHVPDGVDVRGVSAGGSGVHRRGSPIAGVERVAFRVRALPPGRWTVAAVGTSATSDSARPRVWVAETVAQPGDVVELTLEPYEEPSKR